MAVAWMLKMKLQVNGPQTLLEGISIGTRKARRRKKDGAKRIEQKKKKLK